MVSKYFGKLELSENLTFCGNCEKVLRNNSNLNLAKIELHTKFCPFLLKILRRIEILTSIKGHNSDTNLQKMTVHNHNLDLFNIQYKIWSNSVHSFSRY